MKQFLKKPLGLAVAATLAMSGMVAFTNASAATNADALGDLAIIPYYTVKNNFITGIQVINTTEKTQAVKIRLRRAKDSADVLDFDVIMSPSDHFSGYLSKVGDAIVFNTSDNTCTAPINTGTFTSPVANPTAESDEGYIEVIGMGETVDEDEPVALAAKHNAAGVPLDCSYVESNFKIVNVTSNSVTKASAGTPQPVGATPNNGNDGETMWVHTSDNALKVSFFIRDGVSGMEMGDNATHISGFSGDPMMTNQENGGGLADGGLNGFDFPDLDGGGANVGTRGLYDSVIRADLGATSILNNWSYNPANNVATDWVVTIPGQYLMINPDINAVNSIQTDIPVTAGLMMYDREEAGQSGGSIVVSPGTATGSTYLSNEVNVIEWGGKTVFGSKYAISVDPASSGLANPFGWASIGLTSATNPNGDDTTLGLSLGDQVIYDLTIQTGDTAAAPVNPVPVIGFAAWQRKFDTDANKNYGRMVAHSRK